MNADGTPDITLQYLENGHREDWSHRTFGTDRTTWPAGPAPYTDCFHLSGKHDIRANLGTVFAGSENCADIQNLSSDIILRADLWVANGCKYPFTVKGGSTGVGLYGRLQGHGRECDVDAGNWSDQNHDWVRDWELGLIATDGKPIIVRCLAAEMPRLVKGTGPYYFIFPDPRKCYHPFVVAGFNQLRRSGFFK